MVRCVAIFGVFLFVLPAHADIKEILKAKANNMKSWLMDAKKFQYDVECGWLLPEEREVRISEGRCPPVLPTTISDMAGGAQLVEIDLDDSHASHELVSGISLSLTCNHKQLLTWENSSDSSVQWYANSQHVRNRKLDWRVTVSAEGILNIWPLLEDDGGNYECAVDGSVMGTAVIHVVSKADAVVNGLYNYMYGAIFYIPIFIYAVILVGRQLTKQPVKSKREDKMTAFLEQHMLKNGLEVKENIAKVVYGEKFEEKKEEITTILGAGVGKDGEQLRGNHDTIKTLLFEPRSGEARKRTSTKPNEGVKGIERKDDLKCKSIMPKVDPSRIENPLPREIFPSR